MRSIDWLIDRSTHWLIDWSTDWSIDWLIDWSTDRSMDWLIGWLSNRTVRRSSVLNNMRAFMRWNTCAFFLLSQCWLLLSSEKGLFCLFVFFSLWKLSEIWLWLIPLSNFIPSRVESLFSRFHYHRPSKSVCFSFFEWFVNNTFCPQNSPKKIGHDFVEKID